MIRFKLLTVAVAALISTFASNAHADAVINWKGDVLEAPDFFQILSQKFDVVNNACIVKDEKNGQLVGDVNPANGSLFSVAPTPAFWEWYLGCLENATRKMVEVAPNDLCAAVGANGGMCNSEWKKLSAAKRVMLFENLLPNVIPVEIIMETGQDPKAYTAKYIDASVNNLPDGIVTSDVLLLLYVSLMSSDEFIHN